MRIKEIYSQSYKVVKNNKVLWVFGLAVAAATAGSSVKVGDNISRLFNFNVTSESSFSATTKPEFESVLVQVLGFLATVPLSTWLILAASVIVALAIALTLTVLIRSWAVGALIGGTYDALDSRNEISLATVGARGRRSFKGLTGLYIVPQLLVVLIFFPLIGVGFFAIFQQALFGFPLVVISVLGLIFCVILVDVATLWAERIIAIENKPWTTAFWEGLRFLQTNFSDTFKLGFSNTILGCGLGCGLMLIVGPAVGLLIIIGLIPIIGWVLIPLLLPIGLFILLLSVLVNALILTFKYVTWSVLFSEIRNETRRDLSRSRLI